MASPANNITERLKNLEDQLREENPLLVTAVDGFRRLSRIGYATGLLGRHESYATQVPWWPLISVLGTFSAGKSTFINHYLGVPLQDTGNQAVDDKFTVICYSGEQQPQGRVLPGLALDSDPRFPFYQTSEELERVAAGEGRRIDAYLQLKTCHSDRLRGKIIIDSPGFDADAQRSATLRLTNHIIDLSDLVLVFFDARHPEPGAMSDTLAHLVRNTIDRADSSKFLYILNQIDTTAREDNPEEVIGAWQRSLAREGLTAGRFYCIYDPEAAVPINSESLRRRFEWKRDQDLDDIMERMEHVSVERAYRILGALEKRAQEIAELYVPRIRGLVTRWRSAVLRTEATLLVLAVAMVLALSAWRPDLYRFAADQLQRLTGSTQGMMTFASITVGLLLVMHFTVRHYAARVIDRRLAKEFPASECTAMRRVLRKNTRFWRSIFEVDPVGWGRLNRRRLNRILEQADRNVQVLNDRFTDPSGKRARRTAEAQAPKTEDQVVTGEVITGAR